MNNIDLHSIEWAVCNVYKHWVLRLHSTDWKSSLRTLKKHFTNDLPTHTKTQIFPCAHFDIRVYAKYMCIICICIVRIYLSCTVVESWLPNKKGNFEPFVFNCDDRIVETLWASSKEPLICKKCLCQHFCWDLRLIIFHLKRLPVLVSVAS